MNIPESTVYFGNLSSQVDEEILYELALQIAPTVSVHIPKNKLTLEKQGYGFVQLANSSDVPKLIEALNGIRLYGRPIKCSRAGTKDAQVTATLFVGHLGSTDDHKLKQVFQKFGEVVAVDIIANPTDSSKTHAFVELAEFSSADAAIEALNGRLLFGQTCVVEYARRNKHGEKHGDETERKVAALKDAYFSSR